MQTVKVKAVKGIRVPTPHGVIGSDRFIEVPHDLYIRRRLAEGDLVVEEQGAVLKKQKKNKKRRKA